MNLTTAPLPQIFRSSFGPRSMRGNYKMVVLTGHFCANSLKVYGLYNSVAFLRSSSATENFAKKSKGIREGNQIKWRGKNVQGPQCCLKSWLLDGNSFGFSKSIFYVKNIWTPLIFFEKKTRELEKVIRLSDMGKKCQGFSEGELWLKSAPMH